MPAITLVTLCFSPSQPSNARSNNIFRLCEVSCTAFRPITHLLPGIGHTIRTQVRRRSGFIEVLNGCY